MMTRPAPIPTSDSAPFWQACNRDELLYQQCSTCRHVQFYPRRSCVACHGGELNWLASGKRGTIHSFTIVHRAANRAFDPDVPYVVALVDIDEDFRMMMNVVGDDRLAAAIGRRVRIIFEQRTAEQKIPQAVLEAAS
jgi:uncharacterized OB-fold protein